jgi:Right handed beta helix region
MKKERFAFLTLALLSTLNPQLSTLFAQGSLTPPRAPAPTMKSLDQIEPRTPISFLPTNITASGSYYLTTNLTGGTGITISANEVALDLMGFRLVGGTGAGIAVSGARTNLVIRNGTVRGWGGKGVAGLLAVNSVFENLRITDNNDSGLEAGANNLVRDCLVMNNIIGINVGAGTTIRGCTVTANLSDGISTAAGCTVSGCTASGNNENGILTGDGSSVIGCLARHDFAGQGIQVGNGCTVKDCSASANAGSGIAAGTSSQISDCTAQQNQASGISVGDGSIVRDCAVNSNQIGVSASNGCLVTSVSATRNLNTGIQVNLGCLVTANNCWSNAAIGILAAGPGNRFEANNLTFSGIIGLQSGGNGSIIVRNTFRGNATGVSAALDSEGVVQIVQATVGTVTITNLNPWANFIY